MSQCYLFIHFRSTRGVSFIITISRALYTVWPSFLLQLQSACHAILHQNPTVTMDDLKAKHKKELKTLDGEKRNQLKKTKATAGKGKKGKDALAA